MIPARILVVLNVTLFVTSICLLVSIFQGKDGLQHIGLGIFQISAAVLFSTSPSDESIWDPWSSWGPCSQTCDAGIDGTRTRVRECKDGHKHDCAEEPSGNFEVCRATEQCLLGSGIQSKLGSCNGDFTFFE